MRLVWSTVTAVLSERRGLQRLAIDPDPAAAAGALCFPELTGVCSVGDRVLLNTTAAELGLGTGGWHFVVAREGEGLDSPSAGHVMKLRYSPMQRDVLSVEEEASPHHDVMASAEDLGGMPVVCCGLHSQIAPTAAAVRETYPQARIAYVMTDAASLPLALSDLVAECTDAGLLNVTVSTGQAFGGDLEAVTLHSGLLAARHAAGADLAIVANGPGVTGTNTPYGHGGVVQAQALDAAAALGGRAIAVLRISFADARERHRGVSHHSTGVLARLALARAAVAVPMLPENEAAVIESDLERAGVWARHDRCDADGSVPESPVVMRSMGRGPEDDAAFFGAAAAAGRVAAAMLG